MAETPKKKTKQSPSKHPIKPPHTSSPTPNLRFPSTPQTQAPLRRSSRLISSPELPSPPAPFQHSLCKTFLDFNSTTPQKSTNRSPKSATKSKSLKSKTGNDSIGNLLSPLSPDRLEAKKRRKWSKSDAVTKRARVSRSAKSEGKQRRVYYRKVSFDGSEFSVGDNVYVKRREDASSDDEDPEMEECRVCFKAGKAVMIECDDCLGGFHLKCLKPPLKEVPEGDWICGFCEAKKTGKIVELPTPPMGKKCARTAREKLLSSDLWAAFIESIWKEVDGNFWFRGRWYIIPEETASGRQPHNLRRELYQTNDFADIEMESIIRHCFVMNPKEFIKANNEGDDVFLCEYEYDIHWHSFKRIADINNVEKDCDGSDCDENWNSCEESYSDAEEDREYEEENKKNSSSGRCQAHELVAGRIFGLQKIGTRKFLNMPDVTSSLNLKKLKQRFCW